VEGKETFSGKAQFFLVDVESAINEGVNAFWLFDEKASTLDFYSELYEQDTSDFNEEVTTTLGDDLWYPNLFIVERVEVLPQFRGKNLAKLVIDEATRVFAGNTHVSALKAFPLQYEASVRNDEDEKYSSREDSEVSATQKLVKLYESIGFHKIGNDNYMVRFNPFLN